MVNKKDTGLPQDRSSEKIMRIQSFENSDIVRQTLVSLINVASSKTSKAYARTTLKLLLDKLEKKYVVVKFIKIKDAEKIKNNEDAITVMAKANTIEPNEIGRTIQSLVDIYKRELGKKAGYFFIKEFQAELGDDYHSVIKKMGVDLRLVELQEEVYGWDTEHLQIKENVNSNIAFVEKK